MKKYILSIVLTILQLAAVAQTVNVHFKNGQVIEYPSDNIDYINFSAKQSDPSVTSGQVVDLGLSVYWASCNLGADSPEESGDCYAWGETKTKSEFNQSNYSFYDNNTKQFIDIGNDISGTEYDAATVNLGSDWRMPTVTEMSQLLNDCSWEWIQINGVNGYKVTGKNGNSIFIPTVSGNKDLRYSTSSSSKISEFYGLLKLVDGLAPEIYGFANKEKGSYIRPVTPKLNAGDDNVDHTQDYVVTDNIQLMYEGFEGYYSNGTLSATSVVKWKFINNSTEPVTLSRIYMKDSNDPQWLKNYLTEEETINAGESKIYEIQLGYYNIKSPTFCFKYIYNKKRYSIVKTAPIS